MAANNPVPDLKAVPPAAENQQPPTQANDQTAKKPEKVKPKRALPTPRISLSSQLDILRGYAHASGTEGKAVKQNELAAVVNMHPNTITMANPFFLDIGLILRGEGWGYLPAPEVVSYTNAFDWNTDTAGLKLAPVIANSWFAKELMPKLSMRPMDEADAITDLGTAVGVGKDFAPHIRVLLDYMEVSGLIQRDNGRISKKNTPTASANTASTEKPAQSTESTETQSAQGSRSSVSTSFSQPALGVVRFNVSVNVDMAEFAGWKADRIQAFFAGIAQVLAAKGAIEQEASSE
jgi:hypothetical protein